MQRVRNDSRVVRVVAVGLAENLCVAFAYYGHFAGRLVHLRYVRIRTVVFVDIHAAVVDNRRQGIRQTQFYIRYLCAEMNVRRLFRTRYYGQIVVSLSRIVLVVTVKDCINLRSTRSDHIDVTEVIHGSYARIGGRPVLYVNLSTCRINHREDGQGVTYCVHIVHVRTEGKICLILRRFNI